MNIKVSFIVFLFAFCSILSCSEFCEGECFEELNYSLRILSAADSTDLLFGEDKVYDFKDLKIFSLNETDSTFFKIEPFKLGNPAIDSFLLVDHEEFSISRLFLDYGDTDIDTLDFVFDAGDCCGTFRFLNTVTQNGSSIYNSAIDDSYVIIRK